MGSKVAARERMQAAGVPIIPGRRSRSRRRRRFARWATSWVGRSRSRRPPAAEEGPQGRSLGGRGRARLRVRPPRGGGVLLRPGGLCRAVPRGSAPRRGPGARRRARRRRPPRRARLHDPAPPPEARRGDAVARRVRGPPREDRSDRRRRGQSRRLPLGRDDRRAALAGRRVLLPRDEHQDPGGAHGHGAGHGARPHPRAGADRGRGAAMAAPGGRPAERARDRVPDQRGGSVQRLSAGAGEDHGLQGARWAGRAGGLGCRGGSEVVGSTTRWSRSSASTESTGSTRDAGCFARSTSTGSRG